MLEVMSVCQVSDNKKNVKIYKKCFKLLKLQETRSAVQIVQLGLVVNGREKLDISFFYVSISFSFL